MGSPKLFQIGEMARLFHLSVSSIRHYEQLGLLKPEYTDPETGYRYYTPRQFEVFNTIRYLRALDMPLQEIADFLQNRDVDNIEKKLRQQMDAVVRKRQELQRIERKIDNRLRQIQDAQASELGRIMLERTPACRLFRLRESLRIREYQDMELPTSRLAQAQGEAVVFLGKVGVSVSRERLLTGQFEEYDGIFLALDDEDSFEGEILSLPETLCACVRFRGSHPQAPQQYRRLTREDHECRDRQHTGAELCDARADEHGCERIGERAHSARCTVVHISAPAAHEKAQLRLYRICNYRGREVHAVHN